MTPQRMSGVSIISSVDSHVNSNLLFDSSLLNDLLSPSNSGPRPKSSFRYNSLCSDWNDLGAGL